MTELNHSHIGTYMSSKQLKPKSKNELPILPTTPPVFPPHSVKALPSFHLLRPKNPGGILEFCVSHPTHWILQQSLSPLPSNYKNLYLTPSLEFQAVTTSISRGLLQQAPEQNPPSHFCTLEQRRVVLLEHKADHTPLLKTLQLRVPQHLVLKSFPWFGSSHFCCSILPSMLWPPGFCCSLRFEGPSRWPPGSLALSLDTEPRLSVTSQITSLATPSKQLSH